MRVALALLALTLFAAEGAVAGGRASVCNGTRIDLTDVNIAGAVGGHPLAALLHPGGCAILPDLPAGVYTLNFVALGQGQAALCQRKVDLGPGVNIIRIAHGDGSRCIL